MDVAAILELIVKGLGVVETLVAVGQNAEPAIKVLVDLARGVKAGAVTDQQLADAEATLDALIVDFNQPIS
jgi:hypothetical protein